MLKPGTVAGAVILKMGGWILSEELLAYKTQFNVDKE